MSDGPKVLTEPQAWVEALCRVCQLDYRIRRNAGRAARVGKELREVGGKLAEVEKFYGQSDPCDGWWWFRDDWRGKKGQAPTPEQVVETWGRWLLPVAVSVERKYAGLEAWAGAGND